MPSLSEHLVVREVARAEVPRGHRVRPRRAALASGALLGTVGVVASLLIGTPNAGAAPKLTLAQVQTKVNALKQQAEQYTEQYNDTNVKLGSLHVRVKAAQDRQAQQQAEVVKLKKGLGKLAAELYRKGEMSDLQFFLSDDPEAILAQMGVVSSVSDRRDALLKRLEQGRAQLTADTAAVQRQEKAVATAQSLLNAKRGEITRTLDQANAQLSGLKASERRELDRISRSQNQREVQKAQSSTNDAPVKGGIATSCDSVSVTAPSARVAKVLAYACDQIGKPYQWAADGPGSFDCSGFTMMAWKQAGVSLPHSSRQQTGYGTRVSRSNLQAGDLVFFYSPVSHVGIYLGHGVMVHAPSTGHDVTVAPLISSFAMAVRL